MPRPRSLSHEQLAAAALTVLDRDGLAALSMRAVAKELGMSTMALYRYVRDRDELELLVVEFVLAAVDTGAPDTGLPWRERIEVLVRRIRDTLGAHPAVVPLTMTHRHHSRALLRWSETVLTVLTGAGFDGERRVIALRSLIAYVNGALQLEHLGALSGAGTAAISALPPEDFPLMAATGRSARQVEPEREFFGGLAVLLHGLAD
ncbi:TetR/AcrR family transcriptional regulator [Streptomyces murinus]|uniref:TetR/AcrR family transcriptional regulator n=1 Tax=Streptomyces murinus TaxID=33900 RepID=UPI0037280ACD